MGCGIPGVSQFIRTANSTIDKLTTIAKGALCIPTTLGGLLTNMPGILGGLKNNILSTVKGELAMLAGMFANAIANKLAQQFGVITAAIQALQQQLNALASAANCINSFSAGLESRAESLLKWTNDKQNCNALAASLSRCIIANATSGITKKTIRDLNNKTTSVNALVIASQKNFYNNGDPFQKFTDKIAGQFNKANLQVNIIGGKKLF